jgi:hypothetical protein
MITSELLALCRDFSICPDCLDLRGRVPAESGHALPRHEQYCGCWRGMRKSRAGASAPDDSQIATLCRGCGAELLDIGGPVALWFCDCCERWVDRLNEFAGQYAVPIGHAPVTARQQQRLKPALLLLSARDRRLRTWNLRDLGLEPRADVPISTYFDALARHPLDRVARFADLCETFGFTRELALGLSRGELISC